MKILAEWKAEKERRRRAMAYLSSILLNEPSSEADWFVAISSKDKVQVARELQLARRAIALIVAERDALDDRTAADVSHVLVPLISKEKQIDPSAGNQWVDRWLAYSAALSARGMSEPPPARIARVLLQAVGVGAPNAEQVERATRWVITIRGIANESLRAAFGAASLPEDIKPSAIGTPGR